MIDALRGQTAHDHVQPSAAAGQLLAPNDSLFGGGDSDEKINIVVHQEIGIKAHAHEPAFDVGVNGRQDYERVRKQDSILHDANGSVLLRNKQALAGIGRPFNIRSLRKARNVHGRFIEIWDEHRGATHQWQSDKDQRAQKPEHHSRDASMMPENGPGSKFENWQA